MFFKKYKAVMGLVLAHTTRNTYSAKCDF